MFCVWCEKDDVIPKQAVRWLVLAYGGVQNWLIDEISRHLTVFGASLLTEVDLRRTDAASLSLWLAANLPFNDQLKLQLLAMQSPIKRLRCELGFLAKVCTKFVSSY